MRNITVLVLLALLLAPLSQAHHPGSVHGLSAYTEAQKELVHRLPDVQESFAAWEEQWPEMVDRDVIGSTGVLEQPLETIRITDESIPFDAAATPTGQKLRVYLDGGHHGNEFLGVDLVMYYLEDLLTRADADDPETRAFFQTHEVWATPIVNVEGNFLDTRKNANQVDVNRNYGYEWGGPGSGDRITDLNYRGPEAFSEPEVMANAEFARSIQPDLWITTHTGVAEFYWPWGWTFDKAPDHEFFESLEGPFENATNGRVDAMVAAELYLAAGATDDWGYGQLGVPTHTYEVHEDQFVPVYGQGVPAVIQDQLNGLDFMVKNTYHMGAMLVATPASEGLQIHNQGWGRAENITVTTDGQQILVPRIGPDETVVVPNVSGGGTVTWRQLLIDAPEAKDRTTTFQSGLDLDGGEVESPSPALAMLVLALVAIVVIRRR